MVQKTQTLEPALTATTDNVLYFGCRSAKEDYYYSNEWETAAQAGKLTFSVAFSRDQVWCFCLYLF